MIEYRVAAWLAGFVCLGLAGEASAQAVKPAFVKDGKFGVCTTAGFPPLTYYKTPGDARPVGIDIEVVDALAKLWGAEPRFLKTDFAGLLPALQASRCDLVISGIYLNDKRREVYDGVPYFTAATVIVTASATSGIAAPRDLSAKVVAIEAGTGYEKIMTALNEELKAAGAPAATVQTYPTPIAATEQVLLGRAAATLTETAEAGYRLAQTGGRVKIVYTYPTGDRYGIYLRRDKGDLDALRASLKAVRDSGAMAEIAKRNNVAETAFGVDYGS